MISDVLISGVHVVAPTFGDDPLLPTRYLLLQQGGHAEGAKA